MYFVILNTVCTGETIVSMSPFSVTQDEYAAIFSSVGDNINFINYQASAYMFHSCQHHHPGQPRHNHAHNVKELAELVFAKSKYHSIIHLGNLIFQCDIMNITKEKSS